ncbi:MAG: hypothetical protein O6923_07865, partial [Actinobacteria bacterium]|nr:hypothetical protein [Actinomycetota bacterium]
KNLTNTLDSRAHITALMYASKAHFKGLFDLEGALNKARSDSPRHVFGFIDAYNLRRLVSPRH